MPLYSFRNNETGEEYDMMMKYDDKVQYLANHPEIESIISGAPGLVKGTGDHTKPPSGFKEVLSRISENNPTSALANDFGHKDHKSVKKREVVEKHRTKIQGGE
jgi:predicted nucleic acid-binding Zn ribbon protein